MGQRILEEFIQFSFIHTLIGAIVVHKNPPFALYLLLYHGTFFLSRKTGLRCLEDKTAARELEIKRKKIQISAQKISLINKVINSLIEHSLKVIDGSILAIANAIAATQTKGDYYNGYGIKERQEGMTISAIVEDA